MIKEELDILNDFLYSESSWYVYDYQGFAYETIFPIIEKLIKINKEQEEVLDKIKEKVNQYDFILGYCENYDEDNYTLKEDILELLEENE